MWRNYLIVGLRNLIKSRTYAFINVFGLAVGLAACLMLLLYVRYETSYDAWLPDAERTYQLQSEYEADGAEGPMRLQMAPFPAGPALQRDFPQVERIVYAMSNETAVLRNGEALAVEHALFVDAPFFDVLKFPLVRGDPATALAEVGTIVVTQSEARRLFGTEDVVGRTLTLVRDGIKVEHRITGVARDLPANTHVRFSMVARFDPVTAFAREPGTLNAWGDHSGWYYVTLRPNADPAAIAAALPAWERRNIPDERFGDETHNAGRRQNWRLVNIGDVHLGGARDGMTPGNDRRTIMTFGLVAMLILGIACANFVNLATARASRRAREIGLRKVLGATRRQLVFQFMGESFAVVLAAMMVAAALVELLLPIYSSFLDADLSFTYLGPQGMLLPMSMLVCVVSLAGGLYPAFYLTRFRPEKVLKANQSAPDSPGSGRLRNGLVVAQFAVSICLMICTAVIYAQTVHARTVDPGYRRDGLLQVNDIPERLLQQGDMLVREMLRVEGVTSAGLGEIAVGSRNMTVTTVQLPGRSESVNIGLYGVDTGFFETLGIQLVAGRLFERGRAADDTTEPEAVDERFERGLVARGVNVVINELAARSMGFADPAQAVGQQVQSSMVDDDIGLVPTRIIGVVRDFRFRSARDPAEPLMFRYNRMEADNLVVRYRDAGNVRSRVEAAWRRLAPDVPFEAEFSEDIVASLHSGEEARAQTFAGFSMLAVVIACLGLFGLAAFTAERRTKEIGIRKVFGARGRDIVKLLAWQFSKPVIVANLIAWPVAWWVMRDWLNGFDARIALGPAPFLLAGLLALAIAVGTISGHAIRVARANPIHALRYE